MNASLNTRPSESQDERIDPAFWLHDRGPIPSGFLPETEQLAGEAKGPGSSLAAGVAARIRLMQQSVAQT